MRCRGHGWDTFPSTNQQKSRPVGNREAGDYARSGR
jgi:hypothetical protein